MAKAGDNFTDVDLTAIADQQGTPDNNGNDGGQEISNAIDQIFGEMDKQVNGAFLESNQPTADNKATEPVAQESGEEMDSGSDELSNLQERYKASSKEAKRLAEELKQYRQYEDVLPIVDVMRNDPNLFNQVKDYLENGLSPKSPVEQLGLGEDFQFDPEEAFSDPTSDSAKVIDHMLERKLQAKLSKQQMAEAQKSQEQQKLDAFKRANDIDDNKFDEFLEWAQSEKLSLDHLWTLHNLSNRDQKIIQDQMKSRQKQLEKMSQTPKSLAGKAGGSSPGKTPEQEMFELIMNVDNDMDFFSDQS